MLVSLCFYASIETYHNEKWTGIFRKTPRKNPNFQPSQHSTFISSQFCLIYISNASFLVESQSSSLFTVRGNRRQDKLRRILQFTRTSRHVLLLVRRHRVAHLDAVRSGDGRRTGRPSITERPRRGAVGGRRTACQENRSLKSIRYATTSKRIVRTITSSTACVWWGPPVVRYGPCGRDMAPNVPEKLCRSRKFRDFSQIYPKTSKISVKIV